MRKLSMPELERLDAEEFERQEKKPIWLVLDNIRSLQNVGACFRTADAFGIEGLALCGFTGRPPHRDIHRSALGAEETVAWRGFETTVDALAALEAEGFAPIALEQTTERTILADLDRVAYPKIALVLGNELDGVSEEALALCKGSVEIPQEGTKHSLNVSVAAGIALYSLTR
jgi:tRNA G18 (ribose-2'-O)-methylase SpoU